MIGERGFGGVGNTPKPAKKGKLSGNRPGMCGCPTTGAELQGFCVVLREESIAKMPGTQQNCTTLQKAQF